MVYVFSFTIYGNDKKYTHGLLENLRLICPNCHSQTETFGSKNKKKISPSNEKIIDVLKNTKSITEAIRVLGINNVNYKKLQLIVEENKIVQKTP